MNFDIGTAISEATDRMATQAGAVAIAVLSVLGILWTAAQQDIMRESLRNLSENMDQGAMAQNPQAAEQFQRSVDQALQNMPLALGLDSGTASLLVLAAFVAALAAVIVALDAFANERDAIEGIGIDALGWKTLNLFLGTIAMVILVAVGTVFLVIPGIVVGAVLIYFPAPIAIDNENFVSAFGTSVDIASDNILATAGVALIWIFSWVVLSVLGGAVAGLVGGAVGAILNEVIRTVLWVFVLALIARAYAQATRGAGETAVGADEEWSHEPTDAV